ncbi:MAG: ribonuclease P protein subunit [archaeon]
MKAKELKSLLIGSYIEIIESKNKSLIGLKGKVIDQTKNTITIDCKNKTKKIILSQVKIKNDKLQR